VGQREEEHLGHDSQKGASGFRWDTGREEGHRRFINACAPFDWDAGHSGINRLPPFPLPASSGQ